SRATEISAQADRARCPIDHRGTCRGPSAKARTTIQMQDKQLSFVIPAYRLREVGEMVEQYDDHFWRNGHSVRMVVFDESSPANQEKYYPLLERTATHNELYYVGPQEKDHFTAYLHQRLPDK